MKTRTTIRWFAGLAGALLLAVSAVSWASPPGASGVLQGDGDATSIESATGGVCCSNPLKRCRAKLATCREDLAACRAEPCGIFPGDGQTGVPLSYTNNKDGTFTDDNTGLMWEIKDGADGVRNYNNPHDVDNTYTWTAEDEEPFIFNGTAETKFLAKLNAGTGFAGYTDWRLPTIKELQSLVDYSVPYPGPTVAAGLPGAKAGGDYWSSTSNAYYDGYAWYLCFTNGFVYLNVKVYDFWVRAVRGGW